MTRVFPHQLIVLGPPGAGKGTQAQRLAKCLCLVHVSAAVARWADVVVIDASPAADEVTDEILDRLSLIQSERSRLMPSVEVSPR